MRSKAAAVEEAEVIDLASDEESEASQEPKKTRSKKAKATTEPAVIALNAIPIYDVPALRLMVRTTEIEEEKAIEEQRKANILAQKELEKEKLATLDRIQEMAPVLADLNGTVDRLNMAFQRLEADSAKMGVDVPTYVKSMMSTVNMGMQMMPGGFPMQGMWGGMGGMMHGGTMHGGGGGMHGGVVLLLE
ncbi:hypothetical protein CPB83DRAFT_848819 [Crepidotus variabilis]|uniref:Uncharacterized protein n=1 Tax=Crepidotus variabilis TaxID=179855 RepID=A0A9P6ELY9_9AGAR|nr:hypothetical protein CPB83DRAFT_848819 [Crepidotus variabilis]